MAHENRPTKKKAKKMLKHDRLTEKQKGYMKTVARGSSSKIRSYGHKKK